MAREQDAIAGCGVKLDEAVTANAAAKLLGCDHSTVRALLRRGELTGHRVGRCATPRGVRVHLASIVAYRERHAIAQERSEVAAPPSRPQGRRDDSLEEAQAYLKKMGVRG